MLRIILVGVFFGLSTVAFAQEKSRIILKTEAISGTMICQLFDDGKKSIYAIIESSPEKITTASVKQCVTRLPSERIPSGKARSISCGRPLEKYVIAFSNAIPDKLEEKVAECFRLTTDIAYFKALQRGALFILPSLPFPFFQTNLRGRY